MATSNWIVLHPRNPAWPEAYVIVNLEHVRLISPRDCDGGSEVVFEDNRTLQVREDPRQIAYLPRQARPIMEG